MKWVGISDRYIVCPYVFEGSVNSHTYLALLRNELMRKLEHKNLSGKIWLQQDGAADSAISIREHPMTFSVASG
jgi:hypothetical protein